MFFLDILDISNEAVVIKLGRFNFYCRALTFVTFFPTFSNLSCLPTVSCAQPPGRNKSMPRECVHTTVQYCWFCATCSVALSCYAGTCDSSKSAITSSPVDRILIPRCRLDSFQPNILVLIAEWDIFLAIPLQLVKNRGFLQRSFKGAPSSVLRAKYIVLIPSAEWDISLAIPPQLVKKQRIFARVFEGDAKRDDWRGLKRRMNIGRGYQGK